jgi:hypothetical protein
LNRRSWRRRCRRREHDDRGVRRLRLKCRAERAKKHAYLFELGAELREAAGVRRNTLFAAGNRPFEAVDPLPQSGAFVIVHACTCTSDLSRNAQAFETIRTAAG